MTFFSTIEPIDRFYCFYPWAFSTNYLKIETCLIPSTDPLHVSTELKNSSSSLLNYWTTTVRISFKNLTYSSSGKIL